MRCDDLVEQFEMRRAHLRAELPPCIPLEMRDETTLSQERSGEQVWSPYQLSEEEGTFPPSLSLTLLSFLTHMTKIAQ